MGGIFDNAIEEESLHTIEESLAYLSMYLPLGSATSRSDERRFPVQLR